MECGECGVESPDQPEPLLEWLKRQEAKCWVDEMVLGNAFRCAACGAYQDAKDVIVEFDNAM